MKKNFSRPWCDVLYVVCVQCYSDLSRDSTGTSRDYPLCAVELTADMAVAKDTPTCFRRGKF